MNLVNGREIFNSIVNVSDLKKKTITDTLKKHHYMIGRATLWDIYGFLIKEYATKVKIIYKLE